jgi:hypothetical protein
MKQVKGTNMGKKLDNLHRLIRDLESRYGKDDVDVQRLQSELNELKAHESNAEVVTRLTSLLNRNTTAKQHFHGSKLG